MPIEEVHRNDVRVTNVIRDAIVGVLGGPQPPRQTSPYLGRLAAAAVTVVGAAGIALNDAQSSAPFARTLVVVFVILAPTIAITGLLPSLNVAVAVIVAAAGAVVINALVAQAMLSANAWSRPAGVIAIGLIAALLWLVPTTGSPVRTTVSPPGELGPAQLASWWSFQRAQPELGSPFLAPESPWPLIRRTTKRGAR